MRVFLPFQQMERWVQMEMLAAENEPCLVCEEQHRRLVLGPPQVKTPPCFPCYLDNTDRWAPAVFTFSLESRVRGSPCQLTRKGEASLQN